MKYLLTTIFCIVCSQLCAQQDSDSEEVKRFCRILYLDKPAGGLDEAFLFDGTASHRVTLSRLSFSKVVELPPGDLQISFSPTEVSLPEELPMGAPRLNIPSRITNLYILIAHDPSNAVLPFRLKPISIDDNKLKPGETLWINLTNHNVAAQLGEEQVLIPSKKQTISHPPLKTHGYYLAQFIYQRNGEGEYGAVMKKSWWFDASSKYLGFVVESGGRLPKIFTFRDRREPAVTITE